MRSNRKYRDVTPEVLKEKYPTKDWKHRYYKAVYWGRR